MNSLIVNCPNGCNVVMKPSNIVVAEGALNECPSCGQLVSSCSKEYYEKSNLEWNNKEGTWPTKKDYSRLLSRRNKDVRRLAQLLSKHPADIKTLDVGCSNGSTVSIFKELGLQVEGIDPSEQAINDGIQRGLKLHVGYLNESSFEDESFDAITLYEVIEHLSEPSEMFKQCFRILKPNGVLLIGTGNIDSWTRYARGNRWDFFDMKLHGGHISFYSPRSLRILASKTGFRIVKIVTYSVRFVEKEDLPKVLYKIAKLPQELLNLPARFLNKGQQMEVYLKKNKA